MPDKKVIVAQTRSTNRCNKRALRTLQALGLGRIGRSREHILTQDTEGMLRAVQHLVEIRHVK